MILLLSPAKRLDLSSLPVPGNELPIFHDKSIPLIRKLRRFSKPKLMELMDISASLAELNAQRYEDFVEDPDPQSDQLYTAIHCFKGDAYLGLNARELDEKGLEYAQDRIRILSGLYGYLRPLDLIQPYRLEMGTGLKVGRKANLYQYWKQEVTTALLKDLDRQADNTLINLASKEYFSVIDHGKLDVRLIHIHFREYRDGKLKAIQFNLKRARGLMTRYAIDHKLNDSESLKGFNYDGYAYDVDQSNEKNWYFTR